jgi:hypothetical protein
MLIPKSHIEHRGDPGLGFGLLTIWLAPIFILINLFSIFYAKKINDKKIYRINRAGIVNISNFKKIACIFIRYKI